ncbi:MAG TPA: sigma 54-interacting transcriptional regulator, partial [Arachidicoccus soli]|nr:sigma 54-interacting transcriptional regulator [Arachidicoccus soli]
MEEQTLLIIDDDVDICSLLERYFKRKGFKVKFSFNGQGGLKLLKEGGVDIVLSDFRLPDMDGFEVIKAVKTVDSSIPVIVITGYSDVNQAIKSIQLGAYEYVTKPIYPEEILSLVNEALQKRAKSTEKNKDTEPEVPMSSIGIENPIEAFLVPNSSYSQSLQQKISIVAPTNLTVLILGETGTGKEVVARMIHKASKRRNRPFVPVDCGALTQELAASELFGHVKGAFTGATADKKGSF